MSLLRQQYSGDDEADPDDAADDQADQAQLREDVTTFYRQRGLAAPRMQQPAHEGLTAQPPASQTPLAAMRARRALFDSVRLSMGAYMERHAISYAHPHEASYWLIPLDKLPLSREHQQMFSRGPGGRPLHFAGLAISIEVEQAGWEWVIEVAYAWRIAAAQWPLYEEPHRRVWLRVEGDNQSALPGGMEVTHVREQIDLIAYAIPRILWGLATGEWRG